MAIAKSRYQSLRGRIEAIPDDARVSSWREGENPARWRGHLVARLPAARKGVLVQHHPSYEHIGDFVAAPALEFAILTVARSGEVRGMHWGEVDLDGGTGSCRRNA